MTEQEKYSFLSGSACHPMSHKQKSFIEDISEELDIDMDASFPGWRNWSSDRASEFISDNQDDYYRSIEDRR